MGYEFWRSCCPGEFIMGLLAEVAERPVPGLYCEHRSHSAKRCEVQR
jgi:hypothetical protein